MRRREPTAEEVALFEAALKDAVPLHPRPPLLRLRPGAAKAKWKDTSAAVPIGGHASSLSGLDGRTQARLERGSLDPQARLDLHGLSEAAAHRALTAFIRAAAMRGQRLVLVVTGKGLPDDPYEAFDLELTRNRRGLLRQMTPRWLQEPDLVRHIAEVRPAHRRHGGAGALYVYLRKPR